MYKMNFKVIVPVIFWQYCMFVSVMRACGYLAGSNFYSMLFV